MKLNLTSGLSIDSDHPQYVAPGPEGDECGELAPEPPYYRCTRRKGHQEWKAVSAEPEHMQDHAAHGGRGNSIAMYARWASSDGVSRNGDGSGAHDSE